MKIPELFQSSKITKGDTWKNAAVQTIRAHLLNG